MVYLTGTFLSCVSAVIFTHYFMAYFIACFLIQAPTQELISSI